MADLVGRAVDLSDQEGARLRGRACVRDALPSLGIIRSSSHNEFSRRGCWRASVTRDGMGWRWRTPSLGRKHAAGGETVWRSIRWKLPERLYFPRCATVGTRERVECFLCVCTGLCRESSSSRTVTRELALFSSVSRLLQSCQWKATPILKCFRFQTARFTSLTGQKPFLNKISYRGLLL